MYSSLPPLVPSSPYGLKGEQSPPSQPFLFRPVPTKAEKFAKLVRLDRHKVQRPTAHFRNALKTTEGLERVTKQLDKRLEEIEQKRDGMGISFERLSAFRDAFNEVIKLNHAFGPKLNQIKEVYNEHVLLMLSQQQGIGRPHMPGTPITYRPHDQDSKDLDRLKKKMHHLEVEARVLLQENQRLSEELSQEVEFYKKEMARIREEGEAEIERALAQPPPSNDYATKVEKLQEKIMEKQDAISKEYESRKGSIPLTVCHNLEQCLREVEIETQKHHRRNKRLREDIKKCEGQIASLLQTHNLELQSDLGTILGFS